REHGLDLIGLELAHERVEEDDAPGVPESDYRGVGGAAAPRLVRDPHADGGNARALGEPEETRPEIALGEWRAAIEERHEPDRRDEGEEHLAGEEGAGRPQPPPRRCAEQPVHDERGDAAEPAAHESRLHAIDRPAGERLMEEPVATREREAADQG